MPFGLLFLVFGFCFFTKAQNLYEVSLTSCSQDQITILFRPEPTGLKDTLVFSFPATVPGTYDTQDYGRFVTSLMAYTEQHIPLKIKRKGPNRWFIYNAKQLHHIRYEVEDIMDKKIASHPIFQPAATAFIENQLFLLNGGGVFGYLEGEEQKSILLRIKKPQELYGLSALNQSHANDTLQEFTAYNYHQLIDSPLMFSKPDTVQFFVNKTAVTLSVFDVQGRRLAKTLFAALQRDMKAVAQVLPSLPVQRYHFMVYIDDLRELGQVINGGSMPFIKKLKLAFKFKNLGIGALEHGNSSVYYLGDFGNSTALPELSLESQLSSAAIHEFMHIITPLGLHSEAIGNFNYNRPVMSRHLWLYEGVTEYFAHYIKYKGGVYTETEFLTAMEQKLQSGEHFPFQKMSFTEMSAHVLEPGYKNYYTQVYERGAALAFLLDAEIQKLSRNKYTLLDLVLELNAAYGPKRSFKEDEGFELFIQRVHPQLADFFTRYIDGKNAWEPNLQLEALGLHYYDRFTEQACLKPTTDNDLVVKSINGGRVKKIISCGPQEWAGLQPGDLIQYADFNAIYSKAPAENEWVHLPILRKGKPMKLEYRQKYGPVTKTKVLRNLNAEYKQ